MPKTQQENTELLSLTLKTPESAADATVVASMLRALVVLIEETQDELQIEGEFSIRVHPFKEGSLEIPVQVFLVGAATSLFTFNPGLAKLLDTLKSVFELKKYLKGEPPTEKAMQDGVSVRNITINGGNNVINIIQQRRVEEAFDQAAQDLEKDISLTGMKLVNKTTGEEIADVAREEFKYLRIPSNGQAADIPPDRIRTVEALLTIHTPVLPGTGKWKFMYDGRQISASINDQGFLKNVIDGEPLRNGDRLRVELEIGEKFVPAIADYERTNKYSVSKVHQHIPRPDPSKQFSLLTEQSERQ